ncbi:hypothetical protein ACIRRI_52975, partial [Streptomyces mirabilis]
PFLHAHDHTGISVRTITRAAHFERDPVCHNALTQSQRTPAVQEAISAWSKCMNTKGYTVATPYDADKVVPHADGAPSQDEINVALADIDCKKSTNLVTVTVTAGNAAGSTDTAFVSSDGLLPANATMSAEATFQSLGAIPSRDIDVRITHVEKEEHR